MKRVPIDSKEGVPFQTIREVGLLRTLKHPNIVELKNVIWQDNALFLVFEYVDFDLKSYVQHKGKLNSFELRLLARQLCLGLQYIQSHRILHRDLKPQNLLVTTSGNLKIADFGLSRSRTAGIGQLTSEVVTLWYRAPEILLGDCDYGTASDMWSLGAVLCSLS